MSNHLHQLNDIFQCNITGHSLAPELVFSMIKVERISTQITYISRSCLAAGSQFWLFRDLTLQDGYPQPLSALRMGVNLARADEGEEQGAATGRSGLVWDPEEGPVWRDIRGAEEQKIEDTWTQLLNEGVSGITTDSDGDGDTYLYLCFMTWVTLITLTALFSATECSCFKRRNK